MHAHGHEIGSYFPPGMATVETEWPNDDQMDLLITAAGQRIDGRIEVYDEQVIIDMDLPAILGFLRGTLERAVRRHGGKLLEKS